jgi:hypothetical protein
MRKSECGVRNEVPNVHPPSPDFGATRALEHFHQSCSDELKCRRTAGFLVFGFVSAQLQGFSNLLLRQSLAKKPKILAAHRYIFSVNAPTVQRSSKDQVPNVRNASGLQSASLRYASVFALLRRDKRARQAALNRCPRLRWVKPKSACGRGKAGARTIELHRELSQVKPS